MGKGIYFKYWESLDSGGIELSEIIQDIVKGSL